MSELSFIFCFDNKFNKQAYISINSLIENIKAKFNLFIIHEEPESFEKEILFLKSSDKINKVVIRKFDFISNFPNLENKHISAATYYRLAMDLVFEDYIDELDKCIYLDSDILTLNDPSEYINFIFKQMSNNNFLLGARTEYINSNELTKKKFGTLDMGSVKYFNAGVLIFNLKNLVENKTFLQAREILEKNELDFELWDQDILNKIIDGKYFEISNLVNFAFKVAGDTQYINNNVIFLHYQGNGKPWFIKNLTSINSYFFQKYSKKYLGNIYLQKNNFLQDLGFLLLNLFKKNKNKSLNKRIQFIFGIKIIYSYFYSKK